MRIVWARSFHSSMETIRLFFGQFNTLPTTQWFPGSLCCFAEAHCWHQQHLSSSLSLFSAVVLCYTQDQGKAWKGKKIIFTLQRHASEWAQVSSCLYVRYSQMAQLPNSCWCSFKSPVEQAVFVPPFLCFDTDQ